MDYVIIASLFLVFIYLLIKNKIAMMVFQQNWYNSNNWYLHWIKNNIKPVFFTIDILIVILAILGLFFEFAVYGVGLVALTAFIIFRKQTKGKTYKKPLVVTKRVKRLFTTLYLLHLIPLIFLYNKLEIYLLILSSLVYLNYIMLYITNIVNKPIEKSINLSYKNKCIKKLKNLNHMEIIGITGSYGKTSSKNILNDILNIKYNAFPTPKNFNTEMGLVNTVNNYLDKFNDYFIAEMGASNVHQIKQYCSFIKPKYGILTIIGKAHLESFKSIENIQKGKFDLIESLPPDGVGILNADDQLQVNFNLKNKCKIIWIGIDSKADYQATNIKCTNEGTTFDCIIEDKKYTFKTKLLGKYNVYNILAGIALGFHLGIKVEQLQLGVTKVKAVEHRLELKNNGDVTIIDDAYNSNPKGFKMALDVLGMMNGKKIIITPGMVELGEEQYSANNEIGKYMASICDEVILVGPKQTIPIQDGLKEKKYKNMHVVNSTDEAFKLLHKIKDKNTFCLIENDLPDIY